MDDETQPVAEDIVGPGADTVHRLEVEAALFDHPAVADCAVVALHPDADQVVAMVVLRPGRDVGADELSRHVAEQLTSGKPPTRFRFVPGPLERHLGD
jgi:long-chain acyl-CoA synthetase